MEEILIKMARDGDNDAFIKLVKLYQKKLYVVAKAKLTLEEDVRDAIQETLLETYKNIKKIKEIEKFNGWITKVLVNKCNDILRIRVKDTYSYDKFEREKYTAMYDDEYIEIDSNVDLFSMIDFLSNEEKTIVILYFSKGYTSNEISQILNINDSTIRTKIRRIKLKLEEKYRKEMSDDRKDRRYN